jgi:hypothetical protein
MVFNNTEQNTLESSSEEIVSRNNGLDLLSLHAEHATHNAFGAVSGTLPSGFPESSVLLPLSPSDQTTSGAAPDERRIQDSPHGPRIHSKQPLNSGTQESLVPITRPPSSLQDLMQNGTTGPVDQRPEGPSRPDGRRSIADAVREQHAAESESREFPAMPLANEILNMMRANSSPDKISTVLNNALRTNQRDIGEIMRAIQHGLQPGETLRELPSEGRVTGYQLGQLTIQFVPGYGGTFALVSRPPSR